MKKLKKKKKDVDPAKEDKPERKNLDDKFIDLDDSFIDDGDLQEQTNWEGMQGMIFDGSDVDSEMASTNLLTNE